MNTIANKIYKWFCLFMMLIWFFITWSSIFKIYPSITNAISLSALVIVLGTIVTLLSLVLIYRFISRYSDKVHNRIAIFLCLISFFILCLWGLNHQTLPTYDLSHIIDQVSILLNEKSHVVGNSTYLSTYPQQIPLFILLYILSYFGTIINVSPATVIIIYNCLMISLTFLFVYKILKILFNTKIALVGMLLMMITPDFYLYSSYYYTDILSIPFSIMGFYFIIKADKPKTSRKFIWRIIGGIIFAIGFKIRVVTVFLLVAYFINLIFKNNIKNITKIILPIGLSFISFIILYSHVIEPFFKIKIDNHYTLPATHWVMMGVNTENDGGYSNADVKYTINSENKVNANLNKFRERAGKITLSFIDNKIRHVWTQGDHDTLRKYTNVYKIDSSYKYLIGKNSVFIRYIQQITKVCIYILFLIIICGELLNHNNLKNSKSSTILISIFGAFLFYLFWEAQSRYSFSFIPWLIIGGAYGVSLIDKALCVKKILFDRKKFELKIFKKTAGVLIIIFMTFIMLDGFINYCIRVRKINFIRYSQYSTNGSIGIIDNEIKQSFSLDNSFNRIELIFNDDNLTEQIDYEFELYDGDDNLIYAKTFDTTWATKNKYTIIKVPQQKITSGKNYYFKIYSKQATKDNYLKIALFLIDGCNNDNIYSENTGYDVNPIGETYSNNELLCGELRIKIMDTKKGQLIGKITYMVYTFFVLGITICCSYVLLIKEKR